MLDIILLAVIVVLGYIAYIKNLELKLLREDAEKHDEKSS